MDDREGSAAGRPGPGAPWPSEACDPCCLRAGEAGRLLVGHPWRRFVAVGDSIAEGLGDPTPGYRDEPWCDRIARELRLTSPEFAYLNLGIRNTPAAKVRRTQLDRALAFGPDLALVACGGYDLLGFSYDPDAVEAQVRAVVAAFTSQGCDVITVSPFDASRAPGVPPALGTRLHGRLRDFARRTEAIARDAGAVHVALTSHPAAGDADLYSTDPRHGTMRGHAIAAAEAIRALAAHLDTAGRRGR